jgi:hypothetical protein
MDTFQKTPEESYDIYKDFAAPLGSDSIASITRVTSVNERTGADSTSEIIAASPAPSVVGAKVYYWVKKNGGIAGERHKVTVEILTAGGRTFVSTNHIEIWEGT